MALTPSLGMVFPTKDSSISRRNRAQIKDFQLEPFIYQTTSLNSPICSNTEFSLQQGRLTRIPKAMSRQKITHLALFSFERKTDLMKAMSFYGTVIQMAKRMTNPIS